MKRLIAMTGKGGMEVINLIDRDIARESISAANFILACPWWEEPVQRC